MKMKGINGSVKIGETTVLGVEKWSSSLDIDDIDMTTMDSEGHKEFEPGLDEWTASVDVKIDSTQTLLALMPGTKGDVTLLSDSAVPKLSVAGAGYVKSFKPTVELTGAIKATLDWRGSGVCTISITAV